MTREIEKAAAASAFVCELFDHVDDIAFFVKDSAGRYVAVNQSLVTRCAVHDKRELLGRTTDELFPPPLGRRYLEQDLEVCRRGVVIDALLELHLYPNRSEGWCLTHKSPIRSGDGHIIGLVGLSRDLRLPASADAELADVATAVAALQTRYAESIKIDELAASVNLSAYQLNRRIRGVYGITASQLLGKLRIDAASQLLRTSDQSIAQIAAACGYSDQSAFARQFKAACGLTPRQYRAQSQRR